MMTPRKTRWPRAVVLAVFACAMTSRTAAAEGDTRPQPAAVEGSRTDKQVASPGYVIPDAPALTILDATASKLERPGSARELGVSLANIVGNDGTIKAGLAVEITAAVFGLPDKWSYYQYRRDYWRRLLVRSGLSVGTAAGGGSEMGVAADTRVGIGARIVLWDETDPLLDSNLDSADAFLNNALEKGACNGLLGADLNNCKARVLSEFKLEKPRWNAGGMSVAVAQAFALKESKLGDIDSDAFQAWASGAHPLGAFAQLAVGASYEHSFAVEADTAAGALKLRAGGERFRAALDGTYIFARPDADPYRGKLAVGLEVELSTDTWLTGALAADIDEDFDASRVFAVSSIKWGFASEPSW